MKLFSGDGSHSSAQSIHYTLRIASAMCFIGHGAFGMITKAIWCNYFGVFGIAPDLAYRLMPLVGVVDILMGLSLLFYPTRAILGWLVIWGFITASLRPFSGEPFPEMIERAGNYCAPLALLLLSGGMGKAGDGWLRNNNRAGMRESARLWSGIDPNPTADEGTLRLVFHCLRVAVFLLLLGHGWLNLIEKKSLLQQYAAIGFPHPAATARLVGMFEMLAATSVLIRPIRSLVLVFFVWKMATELFYPHWEAFEWVERGGSYGCLLALWLVLGHFPMRHFHTKTTLAI